MAETRRSPGPRNSAWSGGWRALHALVAAAIVAFYAWTAWTDSRPWHWTGPRTDYSNQLLHGFLSGRLSMVVPSDPATFDYNARYAMWRPPVMLDVSRYHGSDYLYFGVAPIVTLFLPWRLLTGQDLPEPAAVVFLFSAGFWLQLAWLARIRRAFAPSTGPAAWLGLLLAVGLGNVAAATLVRPLVYECAMGSAYLWSMASLLALTGAVLTPEKAVRSLALASAAFGLAVASRPNLLPAGIAIAVAAIALARASVSAQRWQILAAALAPAALIGAGLAAYNFARFGGPLDFGFGYQQNNSNPASVFAPQWLGFKLRAYFAAWPAFNGWFPYLELPSQANGPAGYWGTETVLGQPQLWPWLVALGASTALALRRPNGSACVLSVAFAAWFVGAFLPTALFGGWTVRYCVDFVPVLITGAGWLVMSGLANPSVAKRALARAGLGWLLVGAAYNFLLSFQSEVGSPGRDAAAVAPVGAFFDAASWPLSRLFGGIPGPRRFEVRFPDKPAAAIEPLMVAGGPTDTDALLVQYLASGQARLLFDSSGEGRTAGKPFATRPGTVRHLDLQLGTLIPPHPHPWFGGLSVAAQERLRWQSHAEMDGEEVLDRVMPTHPTAPGFVHWGLAPRPAWYASRFSGKLRDLGPTAVDASRLGNQAQPGASLSIAVRLPQDRTGFSEPLLATGRNRAGDLLMLRYVDGSTIQVGHTHAGGDTFWSPRLRVDYLLLQHFGLSVSSVRDSDGRSSVHVTLEGKPVLDLRPVLYPTGDYEVFPLGNPWMRNLARSFFAGEVESIAWTELRPSTSLPLPLTAVEPPPLESGSGFPLMTWRDTQGRTTLLALLSAGPNQWRVRWSDEAGSEEGTPFAAPKTKAWPVTIRAEKGQLLVDCGETTVWRRHEPWPVGGAEAYPWRDLRQRSARSQTDWGGALWIGVPLDELPGAGPILLQVRWPSPLPIGHYEPLLTSGITGAGDAVYVHYLDSGHLAFGFDHWGTGGPESAPIAFDASRESKIRIVLASQMPLPPTDPRVRVELDGRLAFDAPGLCHPRVPWKLVIGANPIGLHTCEPVFTGKVVSAERDEHE